MSVGPDEVRRIARLAELAVDEAELPRLVEQMSRIVDYVAQLDAVTAGSDLAALHAGPDRVTLREDVVRPGALARPPAALAPDFVDGFYVVPVRGTLEEE